MSFMYIYLIYLINFYLICIFILFIFLISFLNITFRSCYFNFFMLERPHLVVLLLPFQPDNDLNEVTFLLTYFVQVQTLFNAAKKRHPTLMYHDGGIVGTSMDSTRRPMGWVPGCLWDGSLERERDETSQNQNSFLVQD